MAAKNIKELAKEIEKLAAKAMQKQNSNVKQVSVKSARDKTESEIYSYEPKQYDRTGKLRDSWVANDTTNGIVVENTYEDNNKDILEVVETAIGYDYTGYGYEYEKPRPVVKPTVDDLKDGRLSDALEKDLNSIGIKTK
ncbi:HK97 gp10 family phage protein [uncultured Metabacillus sp.]|uniref:HK97 gp10 family phage protein n=1 Tax=uncultured Metabacillus sp. TaxID=2860135 RepID=UPI00262EEC28|nr:HK97 gp10 family phage protein [uncultured Metabacillus sp.]